MEVVAQIVGATFLGSGLQRETQVHEVLGQGDLGGLRQSDGLGRCRRTGVADHLRRPGVLILDVGRGVTLERQHLIPGEHIVALPIRQQVLPLDGSDTDDPGNLPTF